MDVAPLRPEIFTRTLGRFCAAYPRSPQHATVPSLRSAHVSMMLAATAVAPVTPEMATGVTFSGSLPLKPQHAPGPSERTAHGRSPAAAMLRTPLKPGTGTAVKARSLVPFPSCPQELSPQHCMDPSDRSAQA